VTFPRPNRASLASVAALLLGFACGVQAPAQTLKAAQADARAGRVDAAEAATKTVLAADPQNADAHALLCDLYGSIEQRDQAITECETAASLTPKSSLNALLLARAYGSKADHSGALTGLRMVGKIRSNFELAVTLDGRNVDALSDLGEFYVAAPGVAGGGLDKARPLVQRLMQLSPARAHRLQAMIYAKDKNDAGAIAEYNAEIAVAHEPEAYYNLASYYRNRKQLDKAAEQARLAILADKEHGLDTLDAAALLIDLKQDYAAVMTGLRAYLTTPQISVARYARAHYMLGQCLQATGDPAGAKKEFNAALALASQYDVARKAANA
jgi:tetratricopeptide (TPR) repeat protein